MLKNTLFNTHPLVVHANGPHKFKPNWKPIKDRFFSSPSKNIGSVRDLSIITFNNGHEAMGLLEKSLNHLGVPCSVYGQGIVDWVNSEHKPMLVLEAVEDITTRYVMGLDSRDVIVLGDPHTIVERFENNFDCALLFAADRLNYPNLKEFKQFEDSIPGAQTSDFRYLSGGCWIGKTDFVKQFFSEVVEIDSVPQAPESEQGILKKLFPRFYPKVQLDYTCSIFQTIGYLATPIFEL